MNRIFFISVLSGIILSACQNTTSETSEVTKAEDEEVEIIQPTQPITNSESVFDIHGLIIDEDDNSISEVTIEVYCNAKLDTTLFSNDTGYYELKSLPSNKMNQIVFKKKNYLSKFCILNTIPPLDTAGVFPLDIGVSLYKSSLYHKEMTRFMLHQPAATSSYNKEIDNMEWNLNEIKNYAEKLNAARKKGFKTF